MFSGDDVDKPIKVLSGGERARVALARLLRRARQPAADGRADEPPRPRVVGEPRRVARRRTTARSCSSATTAALIRTLATRIWNVEDGKVETYPGTLDEYMYSMAQRRHRGRGRPTRRASAATRAARCPSAAPKSRDDDKARKRREAEARQKRSAKLGPLEKQVAQLEERIGVLEAEQKVRSAELADPTRLRRRRAPQQAARRLPGARRTSSTS